MVESHWFASASTVCIVLSCILPLACYKELINEDDAAAATHIVFLALYVALVITVPTCSTTLSSVVVP